MPQHSEKKAVLFDLDGTLVDTAPDLAFALNQVLSENNRTTLSLAQIRPLVSHGGAALIRHGFMMSKDRGQAAEDRKQKIEDRGQRTEGSGQWIVSSGQNIERTQQSDRVQLDEDQAETLRQRLLQIYQQNICTQTRLFPHLQSVLDKLAQNDIAWGIVTNKPDWLSQPLLKALNLKPGYQVLVCGNTLKKAKPHPDTLLHACQQLGVSTQNCLYIGDAARDIQAAKNAAMPSIAAAYGYIEARDPPTRWQADYLAHTTDQLWTLISKHFRLAGN